MTEIPDRILAVEAKAGYRLAVVFVGDRHVEVDLSDMIQRGGVFVSLRDAALFARVRLGAAKDKVEWPEPRDSYGEPMVDIDAESLFHLSMQQRSKSIMQRMIDFLEKHFREPVKVN
jgi:hypothetical protein